LAVVIFGLVIPSKQTAPPESTSTPAEESSARAPTREVEASAETPLVKPLADQIRESLSNSGGFFSSQPYIPAEDISDFSFSPADLQLMINVGDWWSIDAGGVRTHLDDPLATFRRVVDEFPQIERIRVSLVSPAAEERDQWDTELADEMKMGGFSEFPERHATTAPDAP
jgi:hypothetical protein